MLQHDIDVRDAAPVKQHAYRVNLSKRSIMSQEVAYLLERGFAHLSHRKVNALMLPCRFLGMAGFYREFCLNFSSVAVPLTMLLSPSVSFVWSEQCEYAFNSLKCLLSDIIICL